MKVVNAHKINLLECCLHSKFKHSRTGQSTWESITMYINQFYFTKCSTSNRELS